MGKRRHFANSRDWDRHETAKLVYATIDCPFIPDGSFLRKIGGNMSKGGPLLGRLNFVGATTSRYQDLTGPYRSICSFAAAGRWRHSFCQSVVYGEMRRPVESGVFQYKDEDGRRTICS
nr:unnamed protein product [Haemonchus contortus]